MLERTARHTKQSRARMAISIEELIKKFNGICQLCFKPVKNPTRDHIIPLAKGGSSKVSNLQLACKRCNELKSDNLTA